MISISTLEREENVRADIFQAYVALLRQTRPVAVIASDKRDRQRYTNSVALLIDFDYVETLNLIA